jgi:hypothetical protein
MAIILSRRTPRAQLDHGAGCRLANACRGRDLHIKADACGVPVTIRSFAYLRISTDIERSEFVIYGEPIQI